MMNTLLRSAGFALAFTLAGAVHAAQDADDFVEDASAKGVAEVEAAKLAQEKGTAADVKAFAAMMLKDHGQANEKLKSIAASKKLEVSSDADLIDKAKAMILELRGAKSFDQAYANNQVNAHEATIKLFDEYAKDGKDAELRAFAEETLPTLRTHLEKARALAHAHGGSSVDPAATTRDATDPVVHDKDGKPMTPKDHAKP